VCQHGRMTEENTTETKTDLLLFLAGELLALGRGRQLVAIDGVDGSGKSSFVNALAPVIQGRAVVTIHADDFLNLQEVRHHRGRNSPEGFWLDTYDYAALASEVLVPLGKSGDGRYRPGVTDPTKNRRIKPDKITAHDNALILVEGMFLHRNELVGHWSYSVFLDVPFTETARRMAIRDGSHPDPNHPSMRRYVGGQRLYFENAQPWQRATRVIDNTHPDEPRLVPVDEAKARRR
jgi:uridine kinase